MFHSPVIHRAMVPAAMIHRHATDWRDVRHGVGARAWVLYRDAHPVTSRQIAQIEVFGQAEPHCHAGHGHAVATNGLERAVLKHDATGLRIHALNGGFCLTSRHIGGCEP